MPPTLATVAGLAGGADKLRELIAQREAERLRVEQQTYDRGNDATAMALKGRQVGADETRAQADLLTAQNRPGQRRTSRTSKDSSRSERTGSRSRSRDDSTTIIPARLRTCPKRRKQ